MTDTSYALGNGGPNKGLTDEQERERARERGYTWADELRADFKARPPGTVPVSPTALAVHSAFGVLDHHSIDERGES